MKHLILFSLIAFLPLVAFPNEVLDSELMTDEVSTEIVEVIDNEVGPVDCSVTITGNVSTPFGGFEVECKATATDCDEAVQMAADCLDATKDLILSVFRK